MNDLNKKVDMPLRNPIERNKCFKEVSLGYTKEMAIKEANRCLHCKNKPCVKGCPLNIDVEGFVALVSKGDFFEAYKKIKETNLMPAVCGRVCNQENQCERVCIRGIKGEAISIGRLERFVADWARENKVDEIEIDIKNNNKKVAIVGSGPSSLACAKNMRIYGYDVTVFEALHVAGGVLMYGIPEFRLPKEIVNREIELLKNMGIKIKTNMVIGKIFSIDDLLNDGYSAVYIGAGAGLPRFMGIEGENANGVYSANEFLTRVNLMKAYDFPKHDTPVRINKKVAVVGGGNVAMDVARVAKRLDASEVYVVYRRSEAEMPARREEIEHAKEEGIIFRLLENPKRIIKNNDGEVCAIECVNMELTGVDEKGRRKVKEIQGSEHQIEVDTVIMSIGQSPNNLITNETPEIEIEKFGGIRINEETKQSTKEGVFAGGDIVTGAATVTLAIKMGKEAAEAMHEYINEKEGKNI